MRKKIDFESRNI